MISTRIEGQRRIAAGFHVMTIHVPREYLESTPGQFVMLRIKDNDSILLGRPISIHSVYEGTKGAVCELLYQVMGKGTNLLSKLRQGDEIFMTGPLGRGFEIESGKAKEIVLIAGGMGIAPLNFVAEKIHRLSPETQIICYRGARNKEMLFEIEKIQRACTELRLSTDDGSRGYHGFITDLFKKDMDARISTQAAVYACGPHAMIRALWVILKGKGISCQVSVEEKMACGIGACLGCAVRVASGGYKKTCKDGPVFDLQELAMDDVNV